MADEAIIELVDVVKSFGAQRVLDHVNLRIPVGRTTVIAGGSGQGKSVSLKLILGLMRPDSGRILVQGKDITIMKPWELNRMRLGFGVLFQGAALLDSLTVFDNVALPLRERTRLTPAEISDQVFRSLEQFDLRGHEEKYPAQLSGGMKKRVGLARALQLEPKIMLFDEPTTGLDPERTMEIYRLFFDTQKHFGYTSIIVSHDIPKIFNLADQVVLLNQGQIVTFESPEEIQLSAGSATLDFLSKSMGDVYRSSALEGTL